MNLFLKGFIDHFIGDLPLKTQINLAELSCNPRILRNLSLFGSLRVLQCLAINPSTPSDALENIVRRTKDYFTNYYVGLNPNVKERTRRLIKLNTYKRKVII